MESATISQVKNSLSAYLRKVKAGETVLILDRNQPVATLQSIPADLAVESRLFRLEQQGLIKRSATGDPQKALQSPVETSKSVVQALLDERREAR